MVESPVADVRGRTEEQRALRIHSVVLGAPIDTSRHNAGSLLGFASGRIGVGPYGRVIEYYVSSVRVDLCPKNRAKSRYGDLHVRDV